MSIICTLGMPELELGHCMHELFQGLNEFFTVFFLFQDIHTPRSNRSVDSGLPHDDITPRSDSLSTASSASPPDQQQHILNHQQQQMILHQQQQQQHRKSTSLDDINLEKEAAAALNAAAAAGANGGSWRSGSLQRGAVPPSGNGSSNSGSNSNNGTLVIRRKSCGAPKSVSSAAGEEEDIYGRCLNMKLTSFTDENGHTTVVNGQPQQQQGNGMMVAQQGNPRDPRIIGKYHV